MAKGAVLADTTYEYTGKSVYFCLPHGNLTMHRIC
jgi:plastocyanin